MDKREMLLLVKGKDQGGSKVLKDVGDAADGAKDDLEGMNLGLEKLDGSIADTTKTIGDLRAEIAKTGDLELVKDIGKQEARLKAFARQRKALLGDVLPDLKKAGSDGAEDFSVGFVGRIGPLIARAPLSPGLVAAAAGAAPLVANVLSGAVVGGIATGVVAGGVLLAAKDSAVQAGAKSLAVEIGSSFEDAAQPFVPATLRAIGIVRGEFREMDDDLEGIFEDASEYLEPLTRAAMGFGRAMVPGIRDAVHEAGPFFSMLERELPELGQDVGELFSTMAEHADDGADAVGRMLDLLGAAADTTGLLVDGLAAVKKYTSLDVGGEPGTHWSDKYFGNMAKEMVEIKPAGEAGADAINRVGVAAGGLERRAADAAREVETLAETIDRLTNDNISAEQAHIRLEEAIDRGTEAFKENGLGIDANNPKQRDNRQALLDIASASKDAYDDTLKLTGSEYEAAEAAQRGRTAFMALADKMGVSKTQAEILADRLFKIPSRNVTVTANTGPALAAANALTARINNMTARISVSAAADGSFGGPAHSGFGYSTGYAEGGRIKGLPGPRGVDSGYIKAANDEHVITADEVDAAGGHKAVEAWRKSLRSGRPMASASATGTQTSAPHPQPASSASGGFGGADRNFLVWLETIIVNAGGNPAVLGIGGRR